MKRPLSVTLISYLFIFSGAAGIIYHALELTTIFANREVIWVLVVRLLAIVGGMYALKGANWSRWLLTMWIVYHVILSLSHSTAELAMHLAITIVVFICLFHKRANGFFRQG